MQGVAITDVAEAVTCTPSALSKLETGANRRASPMMLAALCQALGIEDRRALLACPYAPDEHEMAEPAHDELADTAELARPDIGENIPIIVSAPRVPPPKNPAKSTPKVPAPELVPEPRSRPRPAAKHRAKTAKR